MVISKVFIRALLYFVSPLSLRLFRESKNVDLWPSWRTIWSVRLSTLLVSNSFLVWSSSSFLASLQQQLDGRTWLWHLGSRDNVSPSTQDKRPTATLTLPSASTLSHDRDILGQYQAVEKEQVGPFCCCCFTAASQTGTGRHQLDNNVSLVLFSIA